MPSGNNGAGRSRRELLKYTGVAGTVGLAGCLGDNPLGLGGSDLGDTLVDENDEQVTLKFVYDSTSDQTETAAQYIGQELEEVGLAIEYDSAPFNTLLARYLGNGTPDMDEESLPFNGGDRDESTSPEDWDLLVGVRFNTYPETPSSVAPFFIDERETAQSSINFYGYRPSDGRDLIEFFNNVDTETDNEARQEMLAEFFGFLSEDQPFGMLQFNEEINGFRSNVTGYDAGVNMGYQSQRWYFTDQSDGSSPAGSYITGSGTDATGLNFIRISDVPSSNRVGLCLDSAYTFDNENNFVGRWIESWESDDSTVYEFTVRDNLQWSDPYGQMTAEDWVYYIQEIRQAENNWVGDTNSGDWFSGEEPINVEQTGELSFQVELPDIDPDFVRKPILWGMRIMPQGLLEPYVEEGTEEAGNELNESEEVQTLAYSGNLGPYTFENWERESRFTAVRNEDYYLRNVEGYENTPLFEERAYQVFGEESTRLSALETGEISATGIPADSAQDFEENEDVDVVLTPTPFITTVAYNQRANGWEPFRQKEVRQAFAYAVDKQGLVDGVYRGYASPAHTYQPEYSQWFDNSQVMETGVGDSHDYDTAKEMLNEALDDHEYI